MCSVPKCPIGMQYSECTKSCSTTCHSLNIQEVCKEECVDGCTCPGNLTLTVSPPSSDSVLLAVLTWCAFVSQWVRFWTVIVVWKCLSVPVCTWADISLLDPLSLRTATAGERAICLQKHAYTNGKIKQTSPLNCFCPAACAVTVPGSAPMKAAPVREMHRQTHSAGK